MKNSIRSPRDVCAIYRSIAEHKLALQAFLREAGSRGARLMISTDKEDIICPLRREGSQVILVRLGQPLPQDLPELVSAARSEGFREFWLAMEDAPMEMAQAAAAHNVSLLSLYSAAAHSGNELLAAIQRHPYVLASGQVRENECYLPPVSTDDPRGDARFADYYQRLLDRRSPPLNGWFQEHIITGFLADAIGVVEVIPHRTPRLVEMKGMIGGYTPVELFELHRSDEIVYPPDRVLLQEFFQHLLNNESGEIDFRLLNRGDDGYTWVRLAGRGIRPDRQEKQYIYLAGRDIDWRKRSEIELEESHKALSAAVDRLDQANRQLFNQKRQLDLMIRQAPLMIWTTDRALNVVSVVGLHDQNGSQEHPSFQGRFLEAIFGEKSYVLDAHRAALRGEVRAYPIEFGGREYLAQVEPIRQSDGEISGVIGVGLDVTDRRKVEAILQLTQAYNRSLLDASLDSLILLDSKGTILAINETAANNLDRSSSALVGRLLPDQMPPAMAQQILNDLNSVIVGRKTIERTLDDREHVLRSRMDPIIDPMGRVAQVSLLVQDITPFLDAERIERRRRETSEMLRSVSEDLTRVTRRNEVLDVVLLGLRWLAPDFSAHIWMVQDGEARLEAYTQHAAVRDRTDLSVIQPMPVSALHYLSRMIEKQQPVWVADVNDDPQWVRFAPTQWIRAYAGAPIVTGQTASGAIVLVSENPGVITSQHLEVIQALAAQTAVALQKVQIFTRLEEKNLALAEAYSELAAKNWALSQAYDATIAGWARALELRDKETEGHSQRVVGLTMRLVEWLGLPGEDHRYLRWGALLHDIGKMAIPDHILLKSDQPLTEQEWAMMKMHPDLAYQMLDGIEYLKPALDIPRAHHEWWDGTGYPRGLKGEEIPLAARLFSVIDAYDALTNPRPYRPAWTVERTISHLHSQSGRQFDPRMVEAFFKMMGFSL